MRKDHNRVIAEHCKKCHRTVTKETIVEVEKERVETFCIPCWMGLVFEESEANLGRRMRNLDFQMSHEYASATLSEH